MEVRLISRTEDPEVLIATAARLCYSNKFDITTIQDDLSEEEIDRFIERLISSRHLTPLEHASFSFAIEGVSRALLAEITRHRIASFSVRSQRYCSEEECDFFYPSGYSISEKAEEIFESSLANSKQDYKDLISEGVAKEVARYVLPNATQTRMIVTMNARELLHFFSLRCCCYDDQTEVLTNEGWKLFKDLNHTELFYSMNPETYECELVKATEYVTEKYQGTMISVKSQSIDQLVTPNHKLYVTYSRDTKTTSYFRLDRADAVDNHKMIKMKKNCNPITGITDSIFNLPGLSVIDRNQYTEWTRNIPDKTVNIKDLMYFLGVYVSDGCISHVGYHYIVNITKGDYTIATKIQQVMSRLSDNTVRLYKDYRKNMNCYRIEVHDRRLYEFCKPLGKTLEKHLPDFIWKYDYTILFSLFQGLIDGDGHYDQQYRSYNFSTISIQLRDQVQKLALHLGYSASYNIVDNRNCKGSIINGREIKSKHVSYDIGFIMHKNEPIIKTTKRNAISETLYDGTVYCVELEKYHLLYIRRNGKTVWSGNTRALPEIQRLAKLMLAEVMLVSPILFKKAGPSCVQLGYCPEGLMCCGKAPTLDQLKRRANILTNNREQHKKRVYVASAFGGDIKTNKANAIKYCQEVISQGFIPVASHLLYPQMLDNNNPDDREKGMQFGLDLIRSCDELWVFGDITPGMQREITEAEKIGIPVKKQKVT